MSEKKTNPLDNILGEFVELTLKNATLFDIDPEGDPLVAAGIKGYVIDFDEKFLYMGDDSDSYSTLISIDEVAIIKLIDVSSNKKDVLSDLIPNKGDVH